MHCSVLTTKYHQQSATYSSPLAASSSSDLIGIVYRVAIYKVRKFGMLASTNLSGDEHSPDARAYKEDISGSVGPKSESLIYVSQHKSTPPPSPLITWN
ncbi:uncharacterized protein FFMR_02116 [Fusarium fujikuroi]|nr:uncharacterized protein FFM5_00074 [Fusarium fujikuroi]SCO30915.1 uncharacterized protein FFMR_02116 [Fusarium fujikuroi]